MQKITQAEAWQDFYTYIRQPGQWSNLTNAEKNRVIIADTDNKGKRAGRGGRPRSLGFERLRRILEQYAPGRYRFNIEESIYINSAHNLP